MEFTKINMEQWARKEYYNHFMSGVVCSYSATVNLDISNLKTQRLYSAMLWILTRTVNKIPEFRTAMTANGLGIYSDMHPEYTIFNQRTKTFTSIWTAFNNDYRAFLKCYEEDVLRYSDSTHYVAKPNRPENTFDVSMVPWLDFTSFNLNVHNGGSYLLPIFTMGKYKESNGKRTLPLAIQVHHAVCDGYHVGQFVELLQQEIHCFV